ncbi:g3266 [Coccomyxa elongata]
MIAVRTGVKQRKMKVATMCKSCMGTKLQLCSVCKGKHFLEWSPFQGGVADMLVLCPLCGSYGEQKCFNCMGEGVVVPVRGPKWFVEEYR